MTLSMITFSITALSIGTLITIQNAKSFVVLMVILLSVAIKPIVHSVMFPHGYV
jgi:hypothetical protein